jgi:hypothetical protein
MAMLKGLFKDGYAMVCYPSHSTVAAEVPLIIVYGYTTELFTKLKLGRVKITINCIKTSKVV